MQMNRPMKQEECDPSPYSRLYTMPTSPCPSKLEDFSFRDSPFSKAASGPFPPRFDFHSLSYATGNGQDDSVPTPVLYQPNIDLSTMRLDQPSHSSTISMFTSSPQKSPNSHVPRPPNAFMLYRSDFLKRGVIPSHVERRQQNLSRIAGQCWNLLPPEEKAQWQDRAAQVLAEHQKRNPDYKFTPAPRGSRRPKAKGRSDGDVDAVDGEERIRQIREEYTRIAGPTASPARRRRPRAQNRSRDLDKEPSQASLPPDNDGNSLPSSVPPSPSPSLPSPRPEPRVEASLPPFFPQYSFPHATPPRRPSTSLGFSTANALQENASLRTGYNVVRPSSAASETGLTSYLKGLDITPIAPTFGYVSSCPSPASSMQAFHASPELDTHFTFPTLDSYPMTSYPTIEHDRESSAHNSDSFLGSLYSCEPFTFNDPPLLPQEDYSLMGDAYLFNNFDLSTFQGRWDLDMSLPDVTKSYTL
ncbi:hypothetical protein FPV67DRAFT_411289 [Lyophyllum atratum]|nr:hypothetical protein FPV67DRAFT_411289 [Lyophyllum atratum]